MTGRRPPNETASGGSARISASLAQLAPGPLGLAVSGGGDSMAMVAACAAMAAVQGWELHVATVNHGLREEAADEAAMVSGLCARLGLPHKTLVWNHTGPVDGNVMDAARRARYALLANWAAEGGISRVALAHTADDQAETVLMGLARASGPDGLCGLRPNWLQDGVTFVRPLLGITRDELRKYLRESELAWVDDPTNDNPAYERSRMRHTLPALAQIGLTVEALAKVARNMALVQESLQKATAEAAVRTVAEVAGALVFDPQALSAEGAEIQRRLVGAAVQWISGSAERPRAQALARFCQAIIDRRPATLAGVVCKPKGAKMWLFREAACVASAVPLGQVWDSRWQAVPALVDAQTVGLHLGVLGYPGLAQLDKRLLRRDIPRDILAVGPAIWHDKKVISAPLAEKQPLWHAKLVQDFSIFVITH